MAYKIPHRPELNDAELEEMMVGWLRPMYLEYNELSRSEMLEILVKAQDWTIPGMQGVFSQIQFPSG